MTNLKRYLYGILGTPFILAVLILSTIIYYDALALEKGNLLDVLQVLLLINICTYIVTVPSLLLLTYLQNFIFYNFFLLIILGSAMGFLEGTVFALFDYYMIPRPEAVEQPVLLDLILYFARPASICGGISALIFALIWKGMPRLNEHSTQPST